MMWYGTWGAGPWPVFPILMCVVMLVMMLPMMLMMGRGMMGGHGGEHMTTPPTDPALDTLRQRFASGEISQEDLLADLADPYRRRVSSGTSPSVSAGL